MAIRVAVVTSLLAALVNQGTAQAFGAGTGGAVSTPGKPLNVPRLEWNPLTSHWARSP